MSPTNVRPEGNIGGRSHGGMDALGKGVPLVPGNQDTGNGLSALLTHLQSEYFNIKKADAILQDHKSQWMYYAECWMSHQERFVDVVQMGFSRNQPLKEQITQPSCGEDSKSDDFELNMDVSEGSHASSFRLPAAAAIVTSSNRSALESEGTLIGSSHPSMPIKPSRQPIQPAQILLSEATMGFNNHAEDLHPNHEMVFLRAPGTMDEAAPFLVHREFDEFNDVDEGTILQEHMSCPTVGRLCNPPKREMTAATTASSSQQAATLTLPEVVGVALQVRGDTCDDISLGESDKGGSDNEHEAVPRKRSELTWQIKPSTTLETLVDQDGSFLPTTLSYRQQAQFEGADGANILPLAIERWADFVCLMLESARKEWKKLLKCWIKDDVFLQKSLKSSGLLDTGFRLGSTRKSRRRRITESTTQRGRALRSTLLDGVEVAGVLRVVEQFGQVPDFPKLSWSRPRSIILNPTSPQRLTWVFVGMCLMLYDLIIFPFNFVFDPGESVFFETMKWSSQIYWTLDIPVSFITAVNISGEVVEDPRVIARVYAKSWLPFDVVVTLPLWVTFVIGDNITGSLRFLRHLRMLRFLRLARLAKLEHLLGEALEFVNSSSAVLIFGIFKLMVYLMILTHFNACLWYYLGNVDEGWARADPFLNRNVAYKYFCAMHWALTQFQGTSDINPGTTLAERFYACCFLVAALMILASFVSSLTNMMMQLQSLKDEKNMTQRRIRMYLSSNQISVNLSMRVKKYVQWHVQQLSRQENDSDVLKILPQNLSMELLYEVRGPLLTVHGLFAMIDDDYPKVFRRVLRDTLETLWQAPQEVVFNKNEDANKMYFINSGQLKYSRSEVTPIARGTIARSIVPGDSLGVYHNEYQASTEAAQELTKGSWLCEQVLWVRWEHCGSLRSVTDASVFAMDAFSFSDVMVGHPAAHSIAVLYARRFVGKLNSFGKTHSDYIPEGMFVKVSNLGNDLTQDEEDDARRSSSVPTTRGSAPEIVVP